MLKIDIIITIIYTYLYYKSKTNYLFYLSIEKTC